MTDDDAKKVILARRARFVAAAMMGTGLVSCKTSDVPTCLSPVQVQDDPPPQVCLSVSIQHPLPPGGNGTTADPNVRTPPTRAPWTPVCVPPAHALPQPDAAPPTLPEGAAEHLSHQVGRHP